MDLIYQIVDAKVKRAFCWKIYPLVPNNRVAQIYV